MAKEVEHISGKDFLVNADGSCYHLGTKPGQVAQRIVTVGSRSRAEKFSKHLENVTVTTSSRDMSTFTGTFKGTEVSIISIGMGSPMMDFMVREASHCQPKPMIVFRVGTCGIFDGEATPGTVMTAGKGSMYSFVNYGKQAGGFVNDMPAGSEEPAFLFSKPIMGDSELNATFIKECQEMGIPTKDGLNACGETFYSCQGRKNSQFEDDGCHTVIETFEKAGVSFVEMETHQLFSLAQRRKVKMRAAAGCIGIVHRRMEGVNVSSTKLHELEDLTGLAAIKAVCNSTI